MAIVFVALRPSALYEKEVDFIQEYNGLMLYDRSIGSSVIETTIGINFKYFCFVIHKYILA